MLVARTVHRGPYEGLSASWGSFEDEIKRRLPMLALPADASPASKWEEAKDIWEWYCVGPGSIENPDQWETDLIRPLCLVSA